VLLAHTLLGLAPPVPCSWVPRWCSCWPAPSSASKAGRRLPANPRRPRCRQFRLGFRPGHRPDRMAQPPCRPRSRLRRRERPRLEPGLPRAQGGQPGAAAGPGPATAPADLGRPASASHRRRRRQAAPRAAWL